MAAARHASFKTEEREIPVVQQPVLGAQPLKDQERTPFANDAA